MRIWPEKLVDTEFDDLGTAGNSGTLNDRQFSYLRDQGFLGSLSDMMLSASTAPVYSPFSAEVGQILGLNIYKIPDDAVQVGQVLGLIIYKEAV